jgi:Signal transduction histidine kinase
MLSSMSKNLMDDLTSPRRESTFSPNNEISSLKKIFAAIGVTVTVTGDLPSDEETARAVIEIISESVTNAVRHALATEIAISAQSSEGAFTMIIVDNGTPLRPPAEMTEGGGISGMRDKLSKLGGTLAVTASPKFKLTIQIPGGETK